VLLAYAAEIRLDFPRCDHEMGRQGFRERVAGDIESGERSGVMGTPTFFLHDVFYRGPFDTASLSEATRR